MDAMQVDKVETVDFAEETELLAAHSYHAKLFKKNVQFKMFNNQ